MCLLVRMIREVLKDSMRNEEDKVMNAKSIAKINTNKNVFMMSIPIFVELMLQLLVGNIDQIMVSRVSQNSVAAIVNANQIINLMIIVLSMSAAATSVILSQYVGAGDTNSASKAAMVSFVMAIVFGLGSAIAVVFAYPGIFEGLHIQQEIYQETAIYLLIVTSMIVVQGLYLNLSSILRTYTLMKEVMLVSVVMNVLNIVGNAILINGWFGMPQMGAIGAAISTNISKVVGLFLMVWIYRKKISLPLGISYLRPFPVRILKNLCLMAIPTSVESLSYNLSQMCILGIVNTFGIMVTATKGYCSIFANLDYVYAMALAQAVQIVLGYLIGAKMLNEIQGRVNATLKAALLACVGMAVILCMAGPWIFLIFTDDPQIIELGRKILAVEIILEAGRAVNIVMTKCLVAVGDIKTPTVVGITFHWGVALLGAYMFGVKMNMGLVGVWIAMAIDECARGVIFAVQFKKERWRRIFRSAV